jgi:hypothetical protein
MMHVCHTALQQGSPAALQQSSFELLQTNGADAGIDSGVECQGLYRPKSCSLSYHSWVAAGDSPSS